MADSISRLKSENCGRKVLGDTYLFLLATRVLPASPNFGQAKHGQNGPAATDCQHCIFTLYVGIILPIGPIPISLFVFDLEAED